MEECNEVVCTTTDEWYGVNLCPPTYDATDIEKSYERFKRFAEDFAIGHDVNPDELLQELAIVNIEDISRTVLAIAVDVMEKGTGDFWVRLESERDAGAIHDCYHSEHLSTLTTTVKRVKHHEFATEEEYCGYSSDDSLQLEKRVAAEGKKAGVKGAAAISAIATATAGATLM